MALTISTNPDDFSIASGDSQDLMHQVVYTFAQLPADGQIDYQIIDPGVVFQDSDSTTRTILITQKQKVGNFPDTISLRATAGVPVDVAITVTVTLGGKTASDQLTARLS